MDLAKYRAVFIEEATEHLAEMSRALLELEKDGAQSEAIDLVFRMAHSIKGMAASLDYGTVTEVAHALEDRMQEARGAGRLEGGEEMALLFRGLDGLEKMVAAVRDTGEPPGPETELVAALKSGAPEGVATEPEPPPKKARSR